MDTIAYISAGSNIGNKAENCQAGIDALSDSGAALIIKQSGFYKTEPVDFKEQDWFVNTVIKIKTVLDPFQLLYKLKSIENAQGRKKQSMRFGPRILDLDIILYGDMILKTSELTIPHPRMHKRCFVLRPLCDIDPDMVHPVLVKNMKFLLNNINDSDQKVLPYTCGS